MSDPERILEIQEAVTISVMAKAHRALRRGPGARGPEVDYIDESEVLTPADEANHVDKWAFTVPFVCGATNLGEALRRIGEGRHDPPQRRMGRETLSRPSVTCAR